MENNLNSLFFRLINEYADIYSEVNRTQNYRHPFSAFIRQDIPNEIRDNSGIDTAQYIVKGSNGAGRWTTVPWIALFDRRITDSAQRGVYIVYLLNKDKKELYLTLNQGATDVSQNGSLSGNGKLAFTGVTGSSTAKSLSKLRTNAIQIRDIIGNVPFATDELIESGAPNYDAGAVCYKKYTLDNLPDDKQLYEDLREFVSIYSKYVEWHLNGGNNTSNENWWPSKDEYDPEITKDQWLSMLSDFNVFSDNARAMFACMYRLGGAATCKQLSAAFGQDSGYYNMVAFHTAEKVQTFTNCPMPPAGKRSKWWPILFVGRDATEDERGTFVWKIREELYEALEEFNVLQYLPNNKIGIFDSWEIIDEDTAMKTCDKSFFDYNSSGVPKGICWFFDAENLDAGQSRDVVILYDDSEFIAKVSNDTTDRRRVKISWNQDLGMLLNSYKGKSKCKAVFSKIDTGYYKLLIKCGEKEMTVKEQVAVIKDYIAAKRFNYEGNLIENFYLSLKSKPFVILAGTSGTGKTRLVKLFAEAIDAKIQLVPVRPDWSDSSDLFGHVDLSGNFQPGAVIDFIREAQSNQAKPFILCLDEMNLARVEYYLSDFLSIIETREWDDNQVIVSDALVDVTDYKNDIEKRDYYGRLIIPENLYIVGTVNMDETTFPFSKKVLDRANTIEFSFVNLMPRRNEQFEQVQKQSLDNTFLKTSYLYLSDCDDTEYVDKVCFELEQLNQILMKANQHVGYRVRDEICFYMMNNKQADLISDEAAYDNAIMQKILPRIQGSSVAIKEALCDLFIKLEGDYTGISAGLAYEQMEKYIAEKGSKYPNTANKIAFMVRRYEEDGFTSYWL